MGADVINIHGGGAFGDKQKALTDFARCLDRISPRARKCLTVENDDRIYTPADLLPLCRTEGIPFVYDVHHQGWKGPKPERHHDFIDVKDFPRCWRELTMTVEVEAKAKELAVVKLKTHLEERAKTRRNRIVQKGD